MIKGDAKCPFCGKTRSPRFEGEHFVLNYDCPQCGIYVRVEDKKRGGSSAISTVLTEYGITKV